MKKLLIIIASMFMIISLFAQEIIHNQPAAALFSKESNVQMSWKLDFKGTHSFRDPDMYLTDCFLNKPIYSIINDPIEKPDFDVFPNPFYESITIKNLKSETAPCHLYIYNISGILVYQKVLSQNETVTLSEIPYGIYILEIRQENYCLKRQKIIKH